MNSRSLFFYCLFIVLIFACQNASEAPAEIEKVEEVVPEPQPSPEELAAAKTAALLEKYTNIDGYIEVTWDTLANMDFDIRFVEELEGEVPFPIFSEALKELAGELVQIKGYVIPLQETGDAEVTFLSAFPYTQCFFCGAAGPESVVDVLAKTPIGELKMDAKRSFRGRLRLNAEDLEYLNYILDDAELVE